MRRLGSGRPWQEGGFWERAGSCFFFAVISPIKALRCKEIQKSHPGRPLDSGGEERHTHAPRVAMAAAAAVTASAEITFGTWGRIGTDVLKVTTETDTDTALNSVGTPWWGNAGTQRLYVNMKNDDDSIGGQIYLEAALNTPYANAQGYVRFLNNDLTLRLGGFQVDDLRGWIGDWGDVDAGQVAGEDDLMTRFDEWRKAGLGLFYRPSALDGKLFLGASFDANETEGYEFKDYLSTVRFGFGYDVGAALLKVMYLGSYDFDDDNYGTLELGANINAIENNLIQVGVKVPLVDGSLRGYMNTEGEWVQTPFADVAAGLSGNADKVSYMAHLRGKFGPYSDNVSDPWIYAGISGGLKLGETLGSWALGFTAKYDITLETWETGTTTHGIGGSVFLEKPYSNGAFDIGLRDNLTLKQNKSASTTTNVLAVPVSVTFWF